MKDTLINRIKLIKQFICNYQILSASIILASAVIIYGKLTADNNRYERFQSAVFDKNTGKLYFYREPSEYEEPKRKSPFVIIRDTISAHTEIIDVK